MSTKMCPRWQMPRHQGQHEPEERREIICALLQDRRRQLRELEERRTIICMLLRERKALMQKLVQADHDSQELQQILGASIQEALDHLTYPSIRS